MRTRFHFGEKLKELICVIAQMLLFHSSRDKIEILIIHYFKFENILAYVIFFLHTQAQLTFSLNNFKPGLWFIMAFFYKKKYVIGCSTGAKEVYSFFSTGLAKHL